MSEEAPFKILQELEERVKKAEQRIPELQAELEKWKKGYTGLQKTAEEQIEALKKDADFGLRFRTLLAEYGHIGEAPPVSTGAIGSVEVHDAAVVLGVKDPKDKLVVETTTVIGQVGQCILDGYIVPKRMRVGEVEELLASHFNAKWGKGQVQMGLETLTAPPYRLFVHTVDSQKRHFFQLRETIKDRILKE